MYQEKPSSSCGGINGQLPGDCAPMVFPYVPKQTSAAEVYSQSDALRSGTLFPGLNLPFSGMMESVTPCENQALCELMALDFAITELGLYLDTHKNDKDAFALFSNYVRLYQEGKEKYEKQYGPLNQTAAARSGSYTWLSDPWPWEVEGGKA